MLSGRARSRLARIVRVAVLVLLAGLGMNFLLVFVGSEFRVVSRSPRRSVGWSVVEGEGCYWAVGEERTWYGVTVQSDWHDGDPRELISSSDVDRTSFRRDMRPRWWSIASETTPEEVRAELGKDAVWWGWFDQAAGWPFPSAMMRTSVHRYGKRVETIWGTTIENRWLYVRLPLRVLWTGTIANVVVLGSLCGVAQWAVVWLARTSARRRDHVRGPSPILPLRGHSSAVRAPDS